MEETDLPRKWHDYFLPHSLEIAHKAKNKKIWIPYIAYCALLLYLIYQQITISHMSQEIKQQDSHVNIFIEIIIAYIQTPYSWNAYTLSSDEQKHPKIYMHKWEK